MNPNPSPKPATTSSTAPAFNPFGPGQLLELEPAHTIHPRAVRGRHAAWRWALVVLTQALFYGLPWLNVAGQQAVLFDLEARRFFLFGAVLFPQDLIWLTFLLVASALLLFLATAVAGRVWCGFACPQTVYTALFTWVEHHIEGDRLARQRLDASPWTPHKLLRRGGKHLAWLGLSLWTGLSLVGWFTPMRSLMPALAGLNLGPWEAFWVLFYGLATYGNAGWLREKVCQHMCPYARFQGAMLDPQTLNVSYDSRRGEPRGHRARHADAAAQGLGACVDCTLCVQVCPAGIDIRHGLQSACINCGLCIDACDTVMDKLAQPRGLIRFASLAELAAPAVAAPPSIPTQGMARGLVQALRRPRVALYASLLGLVLSGLVLGLWTRPTLRLDAMRDRSVMAREVLDDAGAPQVDNLYRLLVMNASAQPRTLQLQVEPAEPGQPAPGLLDAEPLQLAPAEARHLTVRLRLPLAAAQAAGWGSGAVLPVRLSVQDWDASARTPAAGGERASTASTLVLPR